MRTKRRMLMHRRARIICRAFAHQQPLRGNALSRCVVVFPDVKCTLQHHFIFSIPTALHEKKKTTTCEASYVCATRKQESISWSSSSSSFTAPRNHYYDVDCGAVIAIFYATQSFTFTNAGGSDRWHADRRQRRCSSSSHTTAAEAPPFGV